MWLGSSLSGKGFSYLYKLHSFSFRRQTNLYDLFRSVLLHQSLCVITSVSTVHGKTNLHISPFFRKAFSSFISCWKPLRSRWRTSSSRPTSSPPFRFGCKPILYKRRRACKRRTRKVDEGLPVVVFKVVPLILTPKLGGFLLWVEKQKLEISPIRSDVNNRRDMVEWDLSDDPCLDPSDCFLSLWSSLSPMSGKPSRSQG